MKKSSLLVAASLAALLSLGVSACNSTSTSGTSAAAGVSPEISQAMELLALAQKMVAASGFSTESFTLTDQAAKLGLSDAKLALAQYYLEGKGGVAIDSVKAFNLVSGASDAGNLDAMTKLAQMYISAEGTANDYTKAVSLLTKAADGGNSNAQYLLGSYLINGTENLEPNLEKAVAYLTNSATSGNGDAMVRLANLYEEGKGVKKSAEDAIALYKQAAALNNAEAISRLQALGVALK